MRQVITRIDDEVHEQLKARAAAEGRSLNSLLSELLSAGVGKTATPQAVRERARATGRLRVIARPSRSPSWEEVDASTGGAGTSVSAALSQERSSR